MLVLYAGWSPPKCCEQFFRRSGPPHFFMIVYLAITILQECYLCYYSVLCEPRVHVSVLSYYGMHMYSWCACDYDTWLVYFGRNYCEFCESSAIRETFVCKKLCCLMHTRSLWAPLRGAHKLLCILYVHRACSSWEIFILAFQQQIPCKITYGRCSQCNASVFKEGKRIDDNHRMTLLSNKQWECFNN